MEMYARDLEIQHESMLNMADYISSFDHYEAVKQRQESRDSAKQRNFVTDDQFSKQLENKHYKDLYKAYGQAIEKNLTNYSDKNGSSAATAKPKRDMASIARLLRKI